MKSQTKYPLRWAYGTLLLCALIWGGAFIFQKIAMQHVEPFVFNSLRSIISVFTLLPVVIISSIQDEDDFDFIRPDEFKVGLGLGVLLWLALGFQQLGIKDTSVFKTSFITIMYVVFVPIIMWLFYQFKLNVWHLSLMVLAFAGLYFITSDASKWRLEMPELWVLFGSGMWAAHVCVLGALRHKGRVLSIAMMQMLVCSILSGLTSLAIGEEWDGKAIVLTTPSLIYTGLLSGGLAFSLQVFGQKTINPVMAGLFLSLEAVFGGLAGWYLLSESVDTRQVIGAALIMLVVLILEVYNQVTEKPQNKTNEYV